MEMDFQTLVAKALATAPVNRNLVDQFLAREKKCVRYVIGRNAQAAEIVRAIPIDGLIDDYAGFPRKWEGLPIVSMSEAVKDAIVVNCSTSISPVSVLRNLRNAGFERIINLKDLAAYFPECVALPWFVTDQRQDFEAHPAEWRNLYESLADEESRQTLLDVLRYRLTADPEYTKRYSVRLRDQYFEDFLSLKREIFVDAGGFDGDTAEEFSRRYPDYVKIILIEPSKKNMRSAKLRLAEVRDVEYLQIGLSDKKEMLQFNADAGSASAVGGDGGETIHVDTLDTLLAEPVTFVKMDLEGWEIHALIGGQKHIARERPKLAIAVYHKAADFRNVAAYVEKIRPKSKIYLRHYTEGWSETVMYFT